MTAAERGLEAPPVVLNEFGGLLRRTGGTAPRLRMNADISANGSRVVARRGHSFGVLRLYE
jgi:hypothetical protein